MSAKDKTTSNGRVTRTRDESMGALLRMEGLLDDTQIAAALMRQKIEGELFGEALVRLNFVTERDVVRVISKQYSLPFIDVQSYRLTKDALGMIPSTVAKKYQVVPLDKIGSAAVFVTCGPITDEMVEDLELTSGCDAYIFVGTVSSVGQAIADNYDAPTGA